MPVNKPYRIRVKAVDGKPREPNKLKGQLVAHVDWTPVKDNVEFVVCAVKPHHLDQVRGKLAAAGLEEIPGGDTDLPSTTPQQANRNLQGGGRSADPRRQGRLPRRQEEEAVNLSRKPYGFVPLPHTFSTAEPVWYDGTCSEKRLSGEIRFELESLTPLLVGWERRQIDDEKELWPPRFTLVDEAKGLVDLVIGGPPLRTVKSKSLLCPLRATWGERPVIIPGDSIKGLLRHELGALLGAPMERVAERSYSYRPNLKFPLEESMRRLEPRLARVQSNRSIEVNGKAFPVPSRIDIFCMATKSTQSYYPRQEVDRVVNPPREAEPYRGGLGGGNRLPQECLSAGARQRMIHTHLDASRISVEERDVSISDQVIRQYQHTLVHLLSCEHGHFSSRHPHVGTNQTAQCNCIKAVQEAAARAFQPGDLIWVEWDKERKCVVSFGWHYYYRWAYQDTVRCKGWTIPRPGLFPHKEEKKKNGDKPVALTLVRRLFGYTGDDKGSCDIGRGDYEQLMGRISVNAALELVQEGEREEDRFLPPVFLKELGMPRPSAVEFYLKQPYYPNERPSDHANLVTYGDAGGYDTPGELAGRKFYLDRRDAYNGEPWKNNSEANRLNERSTIAIDASKPGRHFRFTLRFRDLDPDELASVLLALCPNQFAETVGGLHRDGYCSKLGYARPLGWGTVLIKAMEMHFLEWQDGIPLLTSVADLGQWFRDNFREPPLLRVWLDIHRHQHPDAADYPRGRNGHIFSFHTQLRAEHTRRRRYKKEERV